MPFFRSSEQFYQVATTVFTRLQEVNSAAAAAVEQVNLLIRLNCTDPAAQVVVDGQRRPAEILFGTNSIRPAVEVTMPADVLHQIMLGELSLVQALGSGDVLVRGQVGKVVALAGLFRQTRQIYPAVLAELGLAG
jgi:hypothetical protein